jgi:hypothetical protein
VLVEVEMGLGLPLLHRPLALLDPLLDLLQLPPCILALLFQLQTLHNPATFSLILSCIGLDKLLIKFLLSNSKFSIEAVRLNLCL